MTTTTAAPSQPQQPILSFPRQTFAKLSPHPYLLAHLQPSDPTKASTRANGRQPSQFRDPHLNNGSLTHAEGSAVVRTGDTTAVCGVRAEILLASDVPGYRRDLSSAADGNHKSNEAKALDLLVPNIELATGCSPAFLPGQPPSTLAQSLSTRLYSLLHSSRLVDDEDLRIWYRPAETAAENNGGDAMETDENATTETEAEIKAFWTLYIDVLFISLDGNPFDVAWAAVVSALRDVRLPYAYWDADREMILCSDEIAKSKKLSLKGLPMASTFVVFRAKEQGRGGDMIQKGNEQKHWILSDPDTFEETLCDESITVTVDRTQGETRLLGVSKSGGTIVGKEKMDTIVKLAEKRWEEWRQKLS